ncbi:hypothetical protein HispidOSU_013107 [Sigmodon hispidus]
MLPSAHNSNVPNLMSKTKAQGASYSCLRVPVCTKAQGSLASCHTIIKRRGTGS